jgi:porin
VTDRQLFNCSSWRLGCYFAFAILLRSLNLVQMSLFCRVAGYYLVASKDNLVRTVTRQLSCEWTGAALSGLLVFFLLLPESSPPAAAQEDAQHLGTGAADSDDPYKSDFGDKATGGWSGERKRLEQAGLTINATLLLEGFDNFRGGLRSGSDAASTFDANVAVDTAKAFGWQGGKFYVDLEVHSGVNPSTRLVGDLQIFDRYNSDPFFQIYEFWYQQKLLDQSLRLKFGKIDANTEFSVIENGLHFLNSSTQVSPTVFGFPTFPDSMPGAAIFFTPSKRWYFSTGAFAANSSDRFGVFFGHPQRAQPTSSGGLFIAETGLRWQHDLLFGRGGNFKVGGWDHTGTFDRLNGGQQNGAAGYYIVVDQALWQPQDAPEKGRGLRGFVSYGQTQSSVSPIDWNVSSGLAWAGAFPDRPKDILGLSINYAHLSPLASLPDDCELALEAVYSRQLREWAKLIPDLQYIIHPGGIHPDALTATLDLAIQF